MKPILLLVDFQRDYLAAPGLEPAADGVVERAIRLLAGCRALGIPVVHVWTTVDRARDSRMPHWKALGKWSCVEGSEGHRPPDGLQPRAGEAIVHKQFFSGFGSGALHPLLTAANADFLIIAGIHLHGCVRATVLDAYERGYPVCVADDAVTSDDPVHAAITRRWLQDRAAQFESVDPLLQRLASATTTEIPGAVTSGLIGLPVALIDGSPLHRPSGIKLLRRSPRCTELELTPVPVAGADEIADATAAARRAGRNWASAEGRSCALLLETVADQLLADASLAEDISEETGKPIRHAREEVTAAAAQLRALAGRAAQDMEVRPAPGRVIRQCPVGVMAVITPWNNPLYIPVGKIGAALIHGNTVVWKPAPAGSSVAVRVMEHLRAAGIPDGVVNLVFGDASTARHLMAKGDVDAVTLTGSLGAGRSAQETCARRHLPLQGELGGNNAAIVWSDADLPTAAARIAEGAFGMAGQRCTANRRVIVEQRCHGEFLALLIAAVGRLSWGDPLEVGTEVGPMISIGARDRVVALLSRARARGIRWLTPHRPDALAEPWERVGAYHPPTVAVVTDSRDELVQEETFGPVLVVQSADDWDGAVRQCNGVRQGLAAALFSGSPGLQRRFLSEVRAGILKINQSTAGAEVDLPFGGWKASGIGPPEHGIGDREFHTRTQTVYII